MVLLFPDIGWCYYSQRLDGLGLRLGIVTYLLFVRCLSPQPLRAGQQRTPWGDPSSSGCTLTPQPLASPLVVLSVCECTCECDLGMRDRMQVWAACECELSVDASVSVSVSASASVSMDV